MLHPRHSESEEDEAESEEDASKNHSCRSQHSTPRQIHALYGACLSRVAPLTNFFLKTSTDSELLMRPQRCQERMWSQGDVHARFLQGR